MCIVFPFLVFFRFSQNDFTQLPELVRWAPTGLRSLLHHDIYMYHVWGRRKQCAKMLRPSPQKFSVMALYIVWLLYLLGLWPVAKYIATSMYYQNDVYMYLLRLLFILFFADGAAHCDVSRQIDGCAGNGLRSSWTRGWKRVLLARVN